MVAGSLQLRVSGSDVDENPAIKAEMPKTSSGKGLYKSP